MKIPIYISLTDKRGREVAHTQGDVFIGGPKESHFSHMLDSDRFPDLRKAKNITYYVANCLGGKEFIGTRELTELTKYMPKVSRGQHLNLTVGYNLLTRT